MTLLEYLKDSRLSDAAFGAQCRPSISRTDIWRIKTGKHSPGAEKVAAIERASGYRVRAEDLIKRKNGHRSPRRVANT